MALQKIYCSKIDREIGFLASGLPICDFYNSASVRCTEPTSKLGYCSPYNAYQDQSRINKVDNPVVRCSSELIAFGKSIESIDIRRKNLDLISQSRDILFDDTPRNHPLRQSVSKATTLNIFGSDFH